MDYNMSTQIIPTEGRAITMLKELADRVWWLINEARIDMCELLIFLASLVWFIVTLIPYPSAMTPTILAAMPILGWCSIGGILAVSHIAGWLFKINWLRSGAAAFAAGWWAAIAVIAIRGGIYLMGGWCCMFSIFAAFAYWRMEDENACPHPY